MCRSYNMTRTILSVASAVLALSSAVHGMNGTRIDAKKDAQIHLYPFSTTNCVGSPIGSPLEMKQGQCVGLPGVHSLKPMFRAEHKDWVDEVNKSQSECKLETFREGGCPDSDKTTKYLDQRSGAMPNDFGHCLVGRHDANDDSSSDDGDYLFYSARFVCDKVDSPELLCTSSLEQTSWSMDPSGNPQSSVGTATYTATLSTTGSSDRAQKRIKPTLEPRGIKADRGESTGIWMLHPWSDSLSCYRCYTKKTGDYGKFECRSGVDYPAQCGPMPDSEEGKPTTGKTTTTISTTALATTHITTTVLTARSSSATTTITITSVPTSTDQSTSTESTALAKSGSQGRVIDTSSSDSDSDSDWPQLDIELSRKSWHTPVKFWHPWVNTSMWCADAEWEKRGRPESYIKIQHCHKCDDKDRSDSKFIGIPETEVVTSRETETSTSTIQHTYSARHDQL